jgi:hypothetical protein
MGNGQSFNSETFFVGGTTSEKESLIDRLDYIASHYILTMDFQNLKKLYDKEYCNKLVIITSDIFDKYFSETELQTIPAERLQDKSIPVIFFNKSDIKAIEQSQPQNKMSICTNLAAFYIKIAHLFAAIVMTIQPDYVYTSQSGKLVKRSLYEKSNVPEGTRLSVLKTNLCGKRINALNKVPLNKVPLNEVPLNEVESNEVPLNDSSEQESPFCYFNLNEKGNTLRLSDEPGIPELMHLYMDDNFDYKTGKFLSMSEASKEQFLKDLHAFYKEFTGEESVPSSITKFSDIKLKKYGSICEEIPYGPFLDRSSDLIAYANNLKQMINSSKEKQEKLLQIINKIFVTITKEDNKQFIRIRPRLSQSELQKLMQETRALIVELYLKCEMDFTKGIQLYEAIIESRIFQTTQMQIRNLQNRTETYYW